MKSLYDIWKIVEKESEESLKSYHVSVIRRIDAQGANLVVSVEDIDKKFGDDFSQLFVSDIRIPVHFTVRFKDFSIGKRIHFLAVDREPSGKCFASLLRYNGEAVDAETDEEFDEKYTKEFIPGQVTCWRDLFKCK